MIVVPEKKKRKVHIGCKLSSTSVRTSEFETSGQRDAMQEREAANLQPEVNTKDSAA